MTHQAEGAQEAAGPRVRDARRAWVLGGSLLIAYAAIALLLGGAWWGLPLLSFVLDVVWVFALLTFALGIRRAGSVVARRPLGVTALAIAAVLPMVMNLVWTVVPVSLDDPSPSVMVDQAAMVIMLAALVIAAVVIARAGAVPRRIRWVPLIVVCVVAGVRLVVEVVTASTGSLGQSGLIVLVFGAAAAAPLGALVLGILAVVFAPRDEPQPGRPVQVYPPGA